MVWRVSEYFWGLVAVSVCCVWFHSTNAAQAQSFTVEQSPTIRAWLPDPLGLETQRQWLRERGVTFGSVLTSESWTNFSGGIKRGSIVQGKYEGLIGIDFEKLAGWQGLTLFSNFFQTHSNGGPNRTLVGGLDTISNIEALPSIRLSELWLEQKFGDGRFGFRFGQLTADSEFFNSQYFTPFLSSDWPTVAKQNLPSGGAAYPLSTPGLRLKFEPTADITGLLALFNGDPAGPGPGEAEQRNRYGLNFRVKDSPLLIGELQYRYNQAADATGLAGGVRIGAWHHFGGFDDLRFDITGLSLADPASTGLARRFRGNQGIYAVFDQQLYRPAGGDANSGIGVFTRISAVPSDRNLNDFYLEGGVIANGVIPGRPLDSAGAVFIYSHITDRLRSLDRDQIFFSGVPQPLRNYELSFELNYSAALAPGWTLQPSLQYTVQPGGNLPDANALIAGAAVKNALFFGLRSTIRY